MNKKLILKLIILIIILWILVIILDCLRIQKLDENNGGIPIITIFVKNYEKNNSRETPLGYVESKQTGTTYIGIGYTITYYNKQQFLNSEPVSIVYFGYSLKLFGFIPISGREDI